MCGGGTGGHFFSGLALAEKILDIYPEKKIIFVGTRLGIEASHEFLDSRMSLQFISSQGLKGKAGLQKLAGLAAISMGVLQSFALLLRYRPVLVVGVGGYASAPTVFAAWILSLIGCSQVMILDQNSSAGLANRLFSFLPGIRAYAAFDLPRFQTVDLPVRQKIEKAAKRAGPVNWPPKALFILGGSQGARGLNARWLNEILPNLQRDFPNLKYIHQTGAKEVDEVRSQYLHQRASAEVFAFTHEIEKFYERADMMICRSGALTVFEVIAFRRPAVFVPFPAATDDHQYKNAVGVQTSNWVLREENFTWKSFEKILKSAEPSYAFRSAEKGKPWREILKELLKASGSSDACS